MDDNSEFTVDPLCRKVAKQIDQYGGKLFADPIERNSPSGPITVYPQRTNNILEQFFGRLRRGHRRRTGNNSMRKTLQAMLADTPLVKNLSNPTECWDNRFFLGCAQTMNIYTLQPSSIENIRSEISTIGVYLSPELAETEVLLPAKGFWGGVKRGIVVGAAMPVMIGFIVAGLCAGSITGCGKPGMVGAYPEYPPVVRKVLFLFAV